MSAQVKWVKALGVDDLWEGDITDVELDCGPVLLVHHLGGKIRAFQGYCPHQEVLLADGDWDEEAGTLICGGHRWEFDVHTGRGINPSDCSLQEYPIQIADSEIRVGIPTKVTNGPDEVPETKET